MKKKNNCIGLFNLFCAICCQLEPGLPLIYHHKPNEIYDYGEAVIEKMHDVASNNIELYKRLVTAKSKQQRQFAKVDIVDLFYNEFRTTLES